MSARRRKDTRGIALELRRRAAVVWSDSPDDGPASGVQPADPSGSCQASGSDQGKPTPSTCEELEQVEDSEEEDPSPTPLRPRKTPTVVLHRQRLQQNQQAAFDSSKSQGVATIAERHHGTAWGNGCTGEETPLARSPLQDAAKAPTRPSSAGSQPDEGQGLGHGGGLIQAGAKERPWGGLDTEAVGGASECFLSRSSQRLEALKASFRHSGEKWTGEWSTSGGSYTKQPPKALPENGGRPQMSSAPLCKEPPKAEELEARPSAVASHSANGFLKTSTPVVSGMPGGQSPLVGSVPAKVPRASLLKPVAEDFEPPSFSLGLDCEVPSFSLGVDFGRDDPAAGPQPSVKATLASVGPLGRRVVLGRASPATELSGGTAVAGKKGTVADSTGAQAKAPVVKLEKAEVSSPEPKEAFKSTVSNRETEEDQAAPLSSEQPLQGSSGAVEACNDLRRGSLAFASEMGAWRHARGKLACSPERQAGTKVSTGPDMQPRPGLPRTGIAGLVRSHQVAVKLDSNKLGAAKQSSAGQTLQETPALIAKARENGSVLRGPKKTSQGPMDAFLKSPRPLKLQRLQAEEEEEDDEEPAPLKLRWRQSRSVGSIGEPAAERARFEQRLAEPTAGLGEDYTMVHSREAGVSPVGFEAAEKGTAGQGWGASSLLQSANTPRLNQVGGSEEAEPPGQVLSRCCRSTSDGLAESSSEDEALLSINVTRKSAARAAAQVPRSSTGDAEDTFRAPSSRSSLEATTTPSLGRKNPRGAERPQAAPSAAAPFGTSQKRPLSEVLAARSDLETAPGPRGKVPREKKQGGHTPVVDLASSEPEDEFATPAEPTRKFKRLHRVTPVQTPGKVTAAAAALEQEGKMARAQPLPPSPEEDPPGVSGRRLARTVAAARADSAEARRQGIARLLSKRASTSPLKQPVLKKVARMSEPIAVKTGAEGLRDAAAEARRRILEEGQAAAAKSLPQSKSSDTQLLDAEPKAVRGANWTAVDEDDDIEDSSQEGGLLAGPPSTAKRPSSLAPLLHKRPSALQTPASTLQTSTKPSTSKIDFATALNELAKKTVPAPEPPPSPLVNLTPTNSLKGQPQTLRGQPWGSWGAEDDAEPVWDWGDLDPGPAAPSRQDGGVRAPAGGWHTAGGQWGGAERRGAADDAAGGSADVAQPRSAGAEVDKVLRQRLPHFCRVDWLEKDGGPVYIDYRNQFGEQESAGAACGGEEWVTGGAGAGRKGGKRRARAGQTKRKTGGASSARGAGGGASSGAGSSKGHWITDGGQKVYVSGSGQQQVGSAAYRTFKKESGGFAVGTKARGKKRRSTKSKAAGVRR